jgi:hypothetical protein
MPNQDYQTSDYQPRDGDTWPSQVSAQLPMGAYEIETDASVVS